MTHRTVSTALVLAVSMVVTAPVAAKRQRAPSKSVRVWEHNYLVIPLQPIPDYRPGDASVADLDGDGRAEVACKTADGTASIPYPS